MDLGDDVSAWLSEYIFDAGSSKVARLMWHGQGKTTREEHRRRHDGSDGDFPAVRKGDVPFYAGNT